jgi:hypothetical protein
MHQRMRTIIVLIGLLALAGVPVWIDWQPAITHNNVIIIDRTLVIGGSYNYS